jgi:hypothetical protein
MKLVPLMTRLTVAGKALTDAGVTPQLFAPNEETQLKFTVALKPSCDAIVIDPLVPVLPTFTLGKAVGSLRINVGLIVTVIAKDAVAGAGAPAVVASNVTT